MSREAERYALAIRGGMDLDTNWENLRFVSIDSESTGPDPWRDRLISLAGVGVRNGEIQLWEQFSVVMPVAYNTASVTLHGITRETAHSEGIEESQAIAGFLEWIGNAILVGHHVQHDVTMLNRAALEHFGFSLRNLVVDTMDAFLSVADKGGFGNQPRPDAFTLDALCQHFHIVLHDRHTALGDAFLTAQILLRILKEASSLELWNLRDLRAWQADRPYPGESGNFP